MKTYRRSALASAAVRMWRGWIVIVPVVIVNATVQALVVWPDPTIDDGWRLYAAASLSALSFVAAFGLVAATALHVPDGGTGWSCAVGALRRNAVRYAIWALGLLVAFSVALALNDALGLLLLGLTPFLLLAAVDGEANPLSANFRTIGRRFWRWLVTALIVGVVIIVGTLLSGVAVFFVRGAAASLLVWLTAGIVVAWFTTAWALVYRSANAEESDVDPVPEPTPAVDLAEGAA